MRRMIDVAVLEQLTLSSNQPPPMLHSATHFVLPRQWHAPVDDESWVGGLGRYFFQ